MVELFENRANSGYSNQMKQSVAADPSLHCLPVTLLGSPDYNGLNKPLLFSFICLLDTQLSLEMFPTVTDISTYGMLTSTNNLATCDAKIRYFYFI